MTGPHVEHWRDVEALLWDFDGVVIDSEYLHYQLWRDQFRAHGLLLSTDAWARHWADRAGLAKPSAAGLLERRLGHPIADVSALTSQVRARYCDQVDALPARPGIEGWLREAAARGVRSVVVTDNRAERVRQALHRLGLDSLISSVVGRDSVLARKPSPDVYRTALHQLGLTAEQAVAVEDAPHGVGAARAAGVRCLAVPHRVTSHLLRPAPGVVIVDPTVINLDRSLALLLRSAQLERQHGDDPDCLRRMCGSLAALAVGDALGKLIDKRPLHELEADTLGVLDAFAASDAPPAVFSGRATDDTVLTLAMASAIITAGWVSRDVLERRLRLINPCGGRQVYKLKATAEPLYVASDGDTNGCVPRSAIIGYLYRPEQLGDLTYDVLKTATLTHSQPDAVMAALVLAVAVSHALAGHGPDETLRRLTTLETGLTGVAGGGQSVIHAILLHADQATRFPAPSRYIDYVESTVGMSAAARSSAVAGLCLGLTGLEPQRVIPALLRRKGRWDLDSVAAIYGALAGAFAPETIPVSWTARVEAHVGESFATIADGIHSIRQRRSGS